MFSFIRLLMAAAIVSYSHAVAAQEPTIITTVGLYLELGHCDLPPGDFSIVVCTRSGKILAIGQPPKSDTIGDAKEILRDLNSDTTGDSTTITAAVAVSKIFARQTERR